MLPDRFLVGFNSGSNHAPADSTEVVVVERKNNGYDYAELISKIKVQMNSKIFNNISYSFKYECDPTFSSPRNFRIIYNPGNRQSYTNTYEGGDTKISASLLAYDDQRVPKDIVDLISKTFNIIKLGTAYKDKNGKIVSPFEIYSPEHIKLGKLNPK